MYIDDIKFWTTILNNVITGLIIGGTGFIIWKWQHNYSKKLEVYTSFIYEIYMFTSLIQVLFRHKDIVNDKSNSFMINANEIYRSFV